MSWLENMYADLAVYLNLPEGAKITHFEEESEIRYGSYCDTCAYDWSQTVFHYTWVGVDKVAHSGQRDDSFTEFLNWVSSRG